MDQQRLSARSKRVLRMTKEGVVEDNLTEGTSTRLSTRQEEAILIDTPSQEVSISPSERQVQTGNKTRYYLHARESLQKTSVAQGDQNTSISAASIPQAMTHVDDFSGQESGQETAQTPSPQAISMCPNPVSFPAERPVDFDTILGKANASFEKRNLNEEISESPAIKTADRYSDAAHMIAENTQRKAPTQKTLKAESKFDEATAKGKPRLRFDDEIKSPRNGSKLAFGVRSTASGVSSVVSTGVHGKLREVENDNSAVEAAHDAEIASEAVIRHYSHNQKKNRNKPYERRSKLEHRVEAADKRLHYEKTVDGAKRQNMSKHYQKQRYKRGFTSYRYPTGETVGERVAQTARKLTEKAKQYVVAKKTTMLLLAACFMAFILLASGISSCSAIVTTAGSSVIASSYLSDDETIMGAEQQYASMEADLSEYLNNYESTHSYDEYHYDLDEIKHDPYVLISILSALHEGEFSQSDIQDTLAMLFGKQYILTETVTTETRYRDEIQTDSNGNDVLVQVPYTYYICNVKLENFDLSHVPVYIMSSEQLSMYATYMSGVGNREDLFPNSEYVDKYITNPPADYTVSPEYMGNESFSRLITEAEKYLGYPYVWGGSSPETSFDCSGFVSYVLTHSGVANTGRLSAQGLYNRCSRVSSADVQPGDLVFFMGTYDTPGVSHVGIYVGDGVMLHCGDPIQYTSIRTSYWQNHFYAYGRPR